MAYLWGKLCLYAGGFGGLLVTFNPHPFAEGSTKQSHEAIYGDEAPPDKYGNHAVVKKIKNGLNKSPLSIKNYFDNDIKAHKLTSKYAKIWNNMKLDALNTNNNNNNKTIQKPINVQIPYITQINKTNPNGFLSLFGFNSLFHQHSDGEYITVEDYLYGKFEKFNSNTGWVKSHTLSINAFSHWTYHISNGQYLICDLQGVDEKNGCYQLTDPVIMSNNKEFGHTDLGIIGISNWFYHHQCNEFCDPNWKKPEKIEKCDDIECERETSHSIDISDLEHL